MHLSNSWLRPALTVVLLVGALLMAGCGNSKVTAPVTLTIALGSSSVAVPQDGAAVTVPLTITGPTGAAAVTLSNLPTGITGKFTTTGTGPSGTLSFTGSTSAPPGSTAATVTVTLAGQTATATVTLVSAVVATVGMAVDTTLGVNGRLEQFMSTSFQIGGWSTNYFGTGSSEPSRLATLNSLGPQHIRVQVVKGAVPMVAHMGASSDWDFTLLDEYLQPILTTADQSPELQIAVAPTWMCDSNGYLDVTNHAGDYAAFMANMVRYYNKGGFIAGGKLFMQAGSTPVTWWGIFNEFNGSGLSVADYVTLYNKVVPAMLAVDSTIKVSALELSDYGLGTGQTGDPEQYLPAFVADPSAGGVKAQVNSISTHLYGGCNQLYTDEYLFSVVPGFAANITYLKQELATRSDLASVPVWVTENNVNADFSDSSGMSVCNPAQTFVTDARGTSAFFAAWRPYVFSQLGKAGNRALYQWAFSSDAQYGEVDSSGVPYLSYWVDRALRNTYPSTTASPGPQTLTLTTTESDDIEALATRNSSGVVTVMIVNRAVSSSTDNNGTGVARTVVVDTSALGGYTAANVLSINASTNLTTGPTSAGVSASSRITVTLPGYGVAFVSLIP